MTIPKYLFISVLNFQVYFFTDTEDEYYQKLTSKYYGNNLNIFLIKLCEKCWWDTWAVLRNIDSDPQTQITYLYDFFVMRIYEKKRYTRNREKVQTNNKKKTGEKKTKHKCNIIFWLSHFEIYVGQAKVLKFVAIFHN